MLRISFDYPCAADVGCTTKTAEFLKNVARGREIWQSRTTKTADFLKNVARD